ncbi:putative nuclear RNA export factor SDE5 [Malania oleifera]|uniref:putative nuclear RNA export factor SDE5 n=1 Tax=Malania oleifera TaxID=397392 RepID=UPI0025AE436E|nr:putative nuclear RNA export factor SDE5 [Malania oleifera]XP_057981271.1 putative nuclear RNA export factor SDE5 [Malania oleifera]
MATMASCSSYFDDETRDLEGLLEAFGSVLSLEAIATVYCEAKRNVQKAGEILFEMQRSTSSDATYALKDEFEEGASATCSVTSSDTVVQKSNHLERNSKSLRPKKCSVSLGTVSGVIGRDYVRSRPSMNGSCVAKKPLKLNSNELPMSEIWNAEDPLSIKTGKGSMREDIEEFMFNMLGLGFRLDMKVIQEVLGLCGYDVKKTMEKLLDISASTLEKSDDIVGKDAAKSIKKYPCLESHFSRAKLQHLDSAKGVKVTETESSKRDKDRYNLQREVLEALFIIPERSEEVPKSRPVRPVRSGALGKLVDEPLQDTTAPCVPITLEPEQVTESDSEDDEDSYKVQRKAVKEYWTIMKEYYKAAVDAFANGEHTRAYKLLEEGHFYSKKAREADEKSAQKLIETNQCKKNEEVSLYLDEQEPKEAISLLRFHLKSLSGIPSIQCLKVILGSNDDVKKGARKRMIIMKLLEKESIKWTEEQNGQALLIRVDEINPKKLSFAGKQ